MRSFSCFSTWLPTLCVVAALIVAISSLAARAEDFEYLLRSAMEEAKPEADGDTSSDESPDTSEKDKTEKAKPKAESSKTKKEAGESSSSESKAEGEKE